MIFIFSSYISIRWNIYFSIDTEPYSEFSQTSKMELFVNKINGLKLLAIFFKQFQLDSWLGFKHVSKLCFYRVIFNKID